MKHMLFSFCLLLSIHAYAEIYEILDENGRKTYTDKPPLNQPDAKPVIASPKASNSWKTNTTQEENDQYYDQLKQEIENNEAQKAAEAQANNYNKQQAADNLKKAEQDLNDARTVKSGDYYHNKSNNGLIYTQEYRSRIKEAEEALEKAKQYANEE
jgi:hypothetical protein